MRTWNERLGGPTPKMKIGKKQNTSKVSSEIVLHLLYSLEEFHYILTTLKCVNS